MADYDDVVVDDDGKIIEQTEVQEDEDQTESTEAEASGGDHEDDGEEHHEEAQGDSDPEREQIRERRREERKVKKERLREQRESMRRELEARDAVINQMQQQLDALQNRSTGAEIAQIDQRLVQAGNAYAAYKAQQSAAIAAGDGETASEVLEKMLAIRQQQAQLTQFKSIIERGRNAAPAADPRLVKHAEEWTRTHSWYDPTGRDMDSRIVKQIDDTLAGEGWNPTTPQYWEELTARVRRYLPHRNSEYNPTRPKPKSVVAGSGRESAPTGNSGGYRLSPDRVHALKEAGMWNDPKMRAEAIKRFREYDKTNGKG